MPSPDGVTVCVHAEGATFGGKCLPIPTLPAGAQLELPGHVSATVELIELVNGATYSHTVVLNPSVRVMGCVQHGCAPSCSFKSRYPVSLLPPLVPRVVGPGEDNVELQVSRRFVGHRRWADNIHHCAAHTAHTQGFVLVVCWCVGVLVCWCVGVLLAVCCVAPAVT